jgi:hypothetical protein
MPTQIEVLWKGALSHPGIAETREWPRLHTVVELPTPEGKWVPYWVMTLCYKSGEFLACRPGESRWVQRLGMWRHAGMPWEVTEHRWSHDPNPLVKSKVTRKWVVQSPTASQVTQGLKPSKTDTVMWFVEPAGNR